MPAPAVPEDNDVYSRLVRALLEARLAADLRQVDLATRLGRPQNYVSRYETLERRIDMGQFVEVARAIGADPVQLLARALRADQNS